MTSDVSHNSSSFDKQRGKVIGNLISLGEPHLFVVNHSACFSQCDLTAQSVHSNQLMKSVSHLFQLIRQQTCESYREQAEKLRFRSFQYCWQ